jgi:hypothetical protein
VLVALLVGTTTIVAISRRTAANRHNVNDSRDVTVRIGRGSTRPAVAAGTHGARLGSTEWRRGSPDDIGRIVITHESTPPGSPHSASAGSPS